MCAEVRELSVADRTDHIFQLLGNSGDSLEYPIGHLIDPFSLRTWKNTSQPSQIHSHLKEKSPRYAEALPFSR